MIFCPEQSSTITELDVTRVNRLVIQCISYENLLAAPNPTRTDPKYRAHVIGFKNCNMKRLENNQDH